MRLEFEYGHGTMAANLPDDTEVFIPGETIPDPPYIPEDELEAKTLESLRNPMGMEPLSKLAKKGSKVTIVFPDRVKGESSLLPTEKSLSNLFCRSCMTQGWKKRTFSLSVPMGFTGRIQSRRSEAFWGMSFSTSSGTVDRSSTTTAKTMNTW